MGFLRALQFPPIGKVDWDYVYTRAKVYGFVTNPRYFNIGFVVPFTLVRTDPLQNCRGYSMNLEISNPENFVGSLYPETYDPQKFHA